MEWHVQRRPSKTKQRTFIIILRFVFANGNLNIGSPARRLNTERLADVTSCVCVCVHETIHLINGEDRERERVRKQEKFTVKNERVGEREKAKNIHYINGKEDVNTLTRALSLSLATQTSC